LKLAGITSGLPYASGKRFKANSVEINIWSQKENHKTHNTIIMVFYSEYISLLPTFGVGHMIICGHHEIISSVNWFHLSDF